VNFLRQQNTVGVEKTFPGFREKPVTTLKGFFTSRKQLLIALEYTTPQKPFCRNMLAFGETLNQSAPGASSRLFDQPVGKPPRLFHKNSGCFSICHYPGIIAMLIA